MATKEALLIDSRPQYVEECASWSLETRRIPDPYWFLVRLDGKLTSSDGKLVENSIDKTSFTGQLEFQAFLRIQDWVGKNNGGVAFWISPRGPYVTTKIIASEIVFVKGRKLLFNTAMIFDDLHREDCLRLTNNLSSRKFNSAEEVRANPVFFKLPTGTPWHRVLEEHIAAPGNLQQVKDGSYIELKQKALRQIEVILSRPSPQEPTQQVVYIRDLENQLRLVGLVGIHPDSCAFDLFLKHSLKKWEYHLGSCILCGTAGVKVGPCEICKSCEAKLN